MFNINVIIYKQNFVNLLKHFYGLLIFLTENLLKLITFGSSLLICLSKGDAKYVTT